MLVDFHTHTTASDGALSPAQLLARARRDGIGMLAITDHDTVAGYRAARAVCEREGGDLRLVSGVEFSCRWSGTTVHIVGLGMDCDHPAMGEGLAELQAARHLRGEKIAERLAACGYPGALEGARREAGESQLGRPHFAAWMVQQGHVVEPGEAFDRYLGQGRAGDVKAFWPELRQVVDWIVRAGGVAVVAHPCKYRFTGMKLRRLLQDFIVAGGGALEIHSGRQSAQQTAQLRRHAAEYRLEVSLGSDFHRDRSYGAPPGVPVPELRNLRAVWERWLP